MAEPLRGVEAQVALRERIERMPRTFTLVEDHGNPLAPVTVLENDSGKQLRFAMGQVLQVEDDRSPDTGTRYLRLWLDDGRHLALSGIGFVFQPLTHSTGPLPDLPPAASFRDFQKLYRHLDHLMTDHHEGREREALQVLMVLLAFLDGARALGLSVDEEERTLEPILERLEKLG